MTAIAPVVSAMSVRFVAPQQGQLVEAATANALEVRLVVDAAEPDALGIDVALDDQRPRRLPAARPSTTLGQLTMIEGTLSPGDHWLFAAPVLASGLVPHLRAEAPPNAVARRFFVATAERGGASAVGAIWLRKPDGTYNGASSRRLLFDPIAFDAVGAALATPCTITLYGSSSGGELRSAAPFDLLDVPSGDYRVTASAPDARSSTSEFTLNRELGSP